MDIENYIQPTVRHPSANVVVPSEERDEADLERLRYLISDMHRSNVRMEFRAVESNPFLGITILYTIVPFVIIFGLYMFARVR